MATFELSPDSIKTLKTRLSKALPEISSSHMYEAIANALGFKTYAALKSEKTKLNAQAYDFSQKSFTQRLITLGYSNVFDKYTTSKKKLNKNTTAWQKLMVYGFNEAIIQGLFDFVSLTETKDKVYNLFEFKLSNGTNVNAGIRNDGFQEMILAVAINPKGTYYCASNSSLKHYDAYAKGWMERKEGNWLQVSDSGNQLFKSKKDTMCMLQELDLCIPLGYNQYGKFML